ncbi:olfactory receptor 142-like [Neolamprologus brichardi]|uniref:olfactory receptor 142-like n=1 Tax=Neolamprologus brichardi TaxID=32507 RepID=UPI0016438253|nr:olfactory receptor 142-like [Neolamprologus brichardi]
MINTTQVSFFTLTGFFDTGRVTNLCFIVILALYIFIVGSNVLLIVVICVNRSLHEPMYMFLCSLFVNELYGSTGLFPSLLVQILSDVYTVSAPLCFLQVFCVHSYGAVEYLNLAIMSYDRYLAICCPLQYNTHMTSKQIGILIAATWFYSCFAMVVLLSLTSPLQFCGNTISKVYCDTHSVVKLACSDTTVINLYGLLATFSTIFGALLFILYTYMKILLVCFSGSDQTRQKAVSTCTPHLASILNFSFGASFEILQSRFNMKNVPNMLRIFLSLYFLTCQPLFNPVMYGLKMTKIRNICKSLLAGPRKISNLALISSMCVSMLRVPFILP